MPLGAVFFAPQADSIEISATLEKSIAGCSKKDHGTRGVTCGDGEVDQGEPIFCMKYLDMTWMCYRPIYFNLKLFQPSLIIS